MFFTISCRKAKVIDINLPESNIHPVVECYIEDGQPLRLLLSESADFYQDKTIPNNLCDGAFITITHSGIIDTLNFKPEIDQINRKVYNYVNPKIVKFKEGEIYTLYVKTIKGEILTSQTSFISVVKIDKVKSIFNSSITAKMKIDFTDNLSTTDYYRLTIAKDSIGFPNIVDLLILDNFFKNPEVSFTPPRDFFLDKSLEVTLYHIDKSYYDYRRSLKEAQEAVKNPFVVPTQLKGNVSGGGGIFQALSYDRQKIYIRI